MNPKGGKFVIPSFGKSSEVSPGTLKGLTQLYDGRKMDFKQTNEGLTITMPAVNGDSYPVVLKAKFKN